MAHIGQLDRFRPQDVDSIIQGLLRVFGRPSAKDIEVLEGKDFGHIYALEEIWKKLGLAEILCRHAAQSGHAFELVGHVKLMVFNRLCDPCSKLSLLEWAQGVYVPGMDPTKRESHHLLRAMDWLLERKEAIEKEVAHRMLTLFDGEPDLVFYDVTSSYFEGDRSVGEGDLRRYGYSRDHRPERRQIVLGLVLSREGLPLAHHVFPADRPDKKTVAEVVRDLKERFGIRRAVFVGDRGLLSEENLEAILDAEFDYLMSLPLRHSQAARTLLEEFEGKWKKGPQARQQFHLQEEEGGLRYAVAFDPEIARESRESRMERLEKAQRLIASVLERLGSRGRRRALSAQRAFEQIHDYLRDRKLLRYFRLELTPRSLTVTADEEGLELPWLRGQVRTLGFPGSLDPPLRSEPGKDSRYWNADDTDCTSLRCSRTQPCELRHGIGSGDDPEAHIPGWQRSSRTGHYQSSRRRIPWRVARRPPGTSGRRRSMCTGNPWSE